MKMSVESVCHDAEVIAVNKRSVILRIVGGADCYGCALSRVCGGDDSGVVLSVPINKTNINEYSAGERVKVYATAGTQLNAMLLCVGIPFLVLIALCGCCASLGFSEIVSAVTGLAGVAAWYAVLYIMRNKLTRKIVWKIDD